MKRYMYVLDSTVTVIHNFAVHQQSPCIYANQDIKNRILIIGYGADRFWVGSGVGLIGCIKTKRISHKKLFNKASETIHLTFTLQMFKLYNLLALELG